MFRNTKTDAPHETTGTSKRLYRDEAIANQIEMDKRRRIRSRMAARVWL